ncbi:Arylsulfotransferase-domain-containing protein [Xylaria venustula]|nr:Arylsulfotransferase-domain-containing protein [Xylaria venustula]
MQGLVLTIAAIDIGVMIQGVIADANLIFDSDGYNRGKYGLDPRQYYRSTNFTSPLLLVNHWDPARTENSSYIFVTLNSPGESQSASPVIYRAEDLSLVYSDPHWSAVHNAHIAQFNGNDYLVFIEQGGVKGSPLQHCLLYDSTYTLAYNISSHSPAHAEMEMHECQLTTTGSAVVILKEVIPYNLTVVGGPEDGKVLDNIIQEIAIETRELLWTWRGSDHYELSESYMEYKYGPGAYDYIHMNSVDRTPEGNFLISARHTHSITLVNRESGSIDWTLGGKKNDFLDLSNGSATNFAWQHHARFYNSTQLTMFDNHNISSTIGCTANCSRGKHVELNYKSRTARLVSEFYHPESLLSGFEGSYQTTRSGNIFLGWGANPAFTEHLPSGECVLDVQFDLWRPDTGYPINYRAFKMDWKAYPTWAPQIATLRANEDGEFQVYVSWNGATEVKNWQLVSDMPEAKKEAEWDQLLTLSLVKLSGNSHDNVTKSIMVIPRNGFETDIILKPEQPFIRAAALGQDGLVLGMTAVTQLTTGEGTSDVIEATG